MSTDMNVNDTNGIRKTGKRVLRSVELEANRGIQTTSTGGFIVRGHIMEDSANG